MGNQVPAEIQITKLLQKNLEELNNYIKNNNLEAYRLLNDNNPLLPVSIDIYGDYAVVHVFAKINDQTVKNLERAIHNAIQVKDIYFKDRTRDNLKLPIKERKEIVVSEYGNKFIINLSDYIDMGLFLDHRETRRELAPQCAGKTLLNLFAYTGSFSVYAANSGAKMTYTVDLSKTYCDWARRNLELNNLPPEKNYIYKMDSLEFLKYAKKKGLMFDIIVIDPPTFSKNKGKNFSVQKDHPELINSALEVLNPKGKIIFSNNCQTFFPRKEKMPDAVFKHINTIPKDFIFAKKRWAFEITHK